MTNEASRLEEMATEQELQSRLHQDTAKRFPSVNEKIVDLSVARAADAALLRKCAAMWREREGVRWVSYFPVEEKRWDDPPNPDFPDFYKIHEAHIAPGYILRVQCQFFLRAGEEEWAWWAYQTDQQHGETLFRAKRETIRVDSAPSLDAAKLAAIAWVATQEEK
jgi:hypothetical protein